MAPIRKFTSYTPYILTPEVLQELAMMAEEYVVNESLSSMAQVEFLENHSAPIFSSKNVVFELLEILENSRHSDEQNVLENTDSYYKIMQMYVHYFPELLNFKIVQNSGSFKVSTLSLKKGAQYSPIHKAAEYGDDKAIEILVNVGGTDVNDRTEPSFFSKAFVNIRAYFGSGKHCKDYWNNTPLHIAAKNGNVSTVKLLINKYNADVNAINGQGQTILHLGPEVPNRSLILDVVLDSGKFTVIHQQDRHGDSILHEFVKLGTLHDIKFLVESGANVLLKNQWPDISDLWAGAALGNARWMNASSDAIKYLEQVSERAFEEAAARLVKSQEQQIVKEPATTDDGDTHSPDQPELLNPEGVNTELTTGKDDSNE